MLKLSDKVKGWTISTVGAGGILSGIGLVIQDPKKVIGYLGAIASAGCLKYGLGYFRRTHSNKREE